MYLKYQNEDGPCQCYVITSTKVETCVGMGLGRTHYITSICFFTYVKIVVVACQDWIIILGGEGLLVA